MIKSDVVYAILTCEFEYFRFRRDSLPVVVMPTSAAWSLL